MHNTLCVIHTRIASTRRRIHFGVLYISPRVFLSFFFFLTNESLLSAAFFSAKLSRYTNLQRTIHVDYELNISFLGPPADAPRMLAVPRAASSLPS